MTISGIFDQLSSNIFGGDASDNLLGGIVRGIEQVISAVVGVFS